jgi:hypothetical protein
MNLYTVAINLLPCLLWITCWTIVCPETASANYDQRNEESERKGQSRETAKH